MEWVRGVGGGAGWALRRSRRGVERGVKECVGKGVRRVVRSQNGIGGGEKKRKNNISTCI
jgi:hypothetical protein